MSSWNISRRFRRFTRLGLGYLGMGYLGVCLFCSIGSTLCAKDSCLIPGDTGIGPRATPENPRGLPASGDSIVLDLPFQVTPVLNSQFGPRQLGSQNRRFDWHRGMDFTLDVGTPLYAPADAVVVAAGTVPGFSDTIIQLQHNSAEPFLYTYYLHLDSVLVGADDVVNAGDPIGLSGQGTASYPHLHWEIRNGCRRQNCTEVPAIWQDYTNPGPPSVPQLEAAGDLPSLGRMVMFSASVPREEVDLLEFRLDWGADTLTGNLNEMNSLTPPDSASMLDDPLFFYESFNRNYAILPERYNAFFTNADYNFLTWGLDTGVSTGTATAADAKGLEAQAALALNLPPLALYTTHQQIIRLPEADISIPYTITNNDSVARVITAEAISAQSLDLDVTPAAVTIPAGGSQSLTITGTLGDWPEGTGDIILLRVSETSGTFTDLLGASLIDTAPSLGMGAAWRAY